MIDEGTSEDTGIDLESTETPVFLKIF